MEIVLVLMFWGYVINMLWKIQLYFFCCWNYIMYSGFLIKYLIFKIVFGMVFVRQNLFVIKVQVYYCMLSYVFLKKFGFIIYIVNILLVSKIYWVFVVIDQENFILFLLYLFVVYEQVILMVFWVLLFF